MVVVGFDSPQGRMTKVINNKKDKIMETTGVTASIFPDELNHRIKLELVKDANKYCWYEKDGNDCEVSADSESEAIKAAISAWAEWDIIISQ